MSAQVFLKPQEIKFERQSVLTVGSFDGVHLGHRMILDEVKRRAIENGYTTTAVTFEPHPQLVLRREGKPEVRILTTIDEKIALLEDAGVDRIVVLPFTREFSQTPSQRFVRDVLYHKVGMQSIVIGHDHGFGKNRDGDVATLNEIGRELGFGVLDLPPFDVDGVVISSTLIRKALLEGEIEKANRWLGAPYRLSGKVVAGEGRGKTIGFPTANLEPVNAHKLIPANGVYAVRIKRDDDTFSGMMNIGQRPTFGELSRTIEAHLFDFSDELYDEILEIYFYARLRPEKKFESVEALSEQLKKDRDRSLKFLDRYTVQRKIEIFKEDL